MSPWLVNDYYREFCYEDDEVDLMKVRGWDGGFGGCEARPLADPPPRGGASAPPLGYGAALIVGNERQLIL